MADADEGGRLQEALHRQRQGGLRRRPCQEHRGSAKEQGIKVLGNDGFDKKAANYRSLASKVNSKKPDCVADSQVVETNGVQVGKDLAAGVPGAKLYGPDGLAISSFVDPKEGGIPASDYARWKLFVATLDPDKYPPSGRKFFADFKKEYPDEKLEPYAIYGYEAMSLVLDAIERAGDKGNNRDEALMRRSSTRRTARACSGPTASTAPEIRP